MAIKNCNQCCVFGQEEKKAAVWLSVFRFRDAFSDVSSNGGCDGEFEVPPTKQRRNERTAKADYESVDGRGRVEGGGETRHQNICAKKGKGLILH